MVSSGGRLSLTSFIGLFETTMKWSEDLQAGGGYTQSFPNQTVSPISCP